MGGGGFHSLPEALKSSCLAPRCLPENTLQFTLSFKLKSFTYSLSTGVNMVSLSFFLQHSIKCLLRNPPCCHASPTCSKVKKALKMTTLKKKRQQSGKVLQQDKLNSSKGASALRKPPGVAN